MEGEERTLLLVLKLLADVGLVGFPNTGKSTFISRVSAARPKIADYPFTTLTPHLGVVKYKDSQSFVIADIPGLIAGAHEGAGMGIQFLRHVERTRVLVHLIDISEETHAGAWENFTAINRELESYNPQLLDKEQLVCLNKIDLLAVRDKVKKTVAQFSKKGIRLHAFSAATGEGLQDILGKIVTLLDNAKNLEL